MATPFQRRQWAILLAWEHGATCQLCGGPVAVWTYGQETDAACTLDHIQPWIYGGPNGIENMQLAHRLCNQRRKWSPEDFPPLTPDQFALIEWRKAIARRKRKRWRANCQRRQSNVPASDICSCAKCSRRFCTRQQAFDCCRYGWKVS